MVMRGSVKVLLASVAMAIVALALLADVSAAEQGTAEILLPRQADMYCVDDELGTLGGKPSCCDKCLCTKSIPPICSCRDWMDFRCDRSCQDCCQSPYEIYPAQFLCRDTFEGSCGEPCTKQ